MQFKVLIDASIKNMFIGFIGGGGVTVSTKFGTDKPLF